MNKKINTSDFPHTPEPPQIMHPNSEEERRKKSASLEPDEQTGKPVKKKKN